VWKKNSSLITDKKDGYLPWRPMYVRLRYLARFFVEWDIIQRKFVEKIKTHILCSKHFSWKSCLLWDKVGKHGRVVQTTDDNVIRLMPLACWVNKAINIGSEFVTIFAFPQQQWLSVCPSMLRYTYIACFVTSLFAHNIKARQVELVVYLPFLDHVFCLT